MRSAVAVAAIFIALAAQTTLGLYGAVAPGEVMPLAKAAAERAIAADPRLSGPHASVFEACPAARRLTHRPC